MKTLCRVLRHSRPARLMPALLLAATLPAAAQTIPGRPAVASPQSAQQPVILDGVIAVINGDVLLRSDLQSEMDMAALQPLSLPAGKGLARRAAQRLIDRDLILQQMQSQGMVKDISHEEVEKDLELLKKQLPACVQYKCQTEEGWARFLADHNLTPEEVETRWHQRMQILTFIDARFRAGMRISKLEIADYYNKTFVPQFKAQHSRPPTLDSVSDRIEQVLLQQHVSAVLQDWLKTLRDQGNVVILDPALGQSNLTPDDEVEPGSGA